MIVRAGAPHCVEARATLSFVRRGSKTVLATSRLEAPLAAIRPFDLPADRLLIQLISLGPGLCGGDRLHIDIAAETGARVIVTTTAATRVMSMDEGAHAEQHVTLRAADGATLEYYPCLTIPYSDCALVQTISADASASARLGVVECWAMGRTARSEYLRFRSLSSRTLVSVDGIVRYGDAIHLDPSQDGVAGAAVLAGRRYLSSVVWCGLTVASASVEPPIAADSLVTLAQSSPGIAYLRALAGDGPEIDRAIRTSIELASRGWGLPLVTLDRFHN